jgi:hypothetical protein
MKRLKAFTIAEMIIVLLLTSLVVVFTGSVVVLFGRQFNGFQYYQNKTLLYRAIDDQLASDWNNCSVIEFKGNLMIIHCLDKSQITYEFKQNEIKRKDEKHSRIYTLNNISWNHQSLVDGLVNQLCIKLDEYPIESCYYKNYDASTLMSKTD